MTAEANREYERAYCVKNRSVLCEQKRTRYQKQLTVDPEKVRAQAREVYHKRKGKVAEQRRVYRLNHTTGKVRGLLCAKCNKGLGQMNDDPATLRSAACYLERVETVPEDSGT